MPPVGKKNIIKNNKIVKDFFPLIFLYKELLQVMEKTKNNYLAK